MDENTAKEHFYNEDERVYETERMYWLGYCLQYWSNRTTLKGKDIAMIYGAEGINQLLDNYKIYHTVDPLFVLEDTIIINNLDIQFDEIIKDIL